jgi:opacity protein-like surface antigen
VKVLHNSAKSLASAWAVLFILSAAATAAFAQQQQPTITARPTLVVGQTQKQLPVASRNNLYCAGYIQSAPVDADFEVVGAEDEREQNVYAEGEFVYVNRGANAGIKVGDVFAVVRPQGRFKTKFSDKKNLGIFVQETGAVEIVKVKENVSVARVKTSCEGVLLGDLLQPMPERVSPVHQQRPALDLFREPNGKAQGSIVLSRDGREALTAEQIVYIDLGAEDEVKVGDYFTIYRPLGKGGVLNSDQKESVSARDDGFRSERFSSGGFSILAPRRKVTGESTGSIVTRREAKTRRPAGLRQVVGELVVLNVKERTATALITRNAMEIHPGDRVELQ